MTMPRSRCDTQAANRANEIPEKAASISESARPAPHYNRLDISPEFHLSLQAPCLRPRYARPAAPANGGYDRCALAKSAGSSQKLFLVQGGASCNKQVISATSSRKGIAP